MMMTAIKAMTAFCKLHDLGEWALLVWTGKADFSRYPDVALFGGWIS